MCVLTGYLFEVEFCYIACGMSPKAERFGEDSRPIRGTFKYVAFRHVEPRLSVVSVGDEVIEVAGLGPSGTARPAGRGGL